MIIAYIGAQCSAKSTRAEAVTKALQTLGHDAVMLHEIARLCPYPLDKGANIRTQMWILTEQIVQEQQLQSKHDIVISDRSTIDPYVYGLWLTSDGAMTIDECGILLRRSRHHWNNYDKIYLCNPRPMYDDGFRNVDVRYQYEIYAGFEHTLNLHNIEHEVI